MQHQAIPPPEDDGGSARRSLSGLRGSIGLRLLVRVLLFSLAITLLLTLVQLYLDYRREVRAIDQRIAEIDDQVDDDIDHGGEQPELPGVSCPGIRLMVSNRCSVANWLAGARRRVPRGC